MPPSHAEMLLSQLTEARSELAVTNHRLDAAAAENLSLRTDVKALTARVELLERERAEDRAARRAVEKAVEKERASSGEWWGRVASWVGVGIAILFGLGSAAWALFVRGEK